MFIISLVSFQYENLFNNTLNTLNYCLDIQLFWIRIRIRVFLNKLFIQEILKIFKIIVKSYWFEFNFKRYKNSYFSNSLKVVTR